jgi:hypothetical protein
LQAARSRRTGVTRAARAKAGFISPPQVDP